MVGTLIGTKQAAWLLAANNANRAKKAVAGRPLSSAADKGWGPLRFSACLSTWLRCFARLLATEAPAETYQGSQNHFSSCDERTM